MGLNCRISQCLINSLLIILRKYNGFEKLPKDARTPLLQTPVVDFNQIRLVNPNGKYFHFGLTDSLLKYYSNISMPKKIKLVLGIDGLPIARSSNSQFWPILAYVRPENYLDKKKYFLLVYIGVKISLLIVTNICMTL